MKKKSIGIKGDGKFIEIDKRKLKSIIRRMRKGDAFEEFKKHMRTLRGEKK